MKMMNLDEEGKSAVKRDNLGVIINEDQSKKKFDLFNSLDEEIGSNIIFLFFEDYLSFFYLLVFSGS
jgi:hypothetical protein